MDRGDSNEKPIWSSGDYDLAYEMSENNTRQVNLTLSSTDLLEPLSSNRTLYLHYQMSAPNIWGLNHMGYAFQPNDYYKTTPNLKPFTDDPKIPLQVYRKSISLVRHMKQVKEEDTANLL